MWPLVLYVIYELTDKGEKEVSVDEIVYTVYDRLWKRYGIALYDSRDDVKEVIKSFEKDGYITIDENGKIKINNKELVEEIVNKLQILAKEPDTTIHYIFKNVNDLVEEVKRLK